jgi:hypothetical protein
VFVGVLFENFVFVTLLLLVLFIIQVVGLITEKFVGFINFLEFFCLNYFSWQ